MNAQINLDQTSLKKINTDNNLNVKNNKLYGNVAVSQNRNVLNGPAAKHRSDDRRAEYIYVFSQEQLRTVTRSPRWSLAIRHHRRARLLL
jgi:hypothetical protein